MPGGVRAPRAAAPADPTARPPNRRLRGLHLAGGRRGSPRAEPLAHFSCRQARHTRRFAAAISSKARPRLRDASCWWRTTSRAGLGFSAKIWASALLFAVREERVLLEVPRGEIRRRSLVPDLDEGHGVPNTPTEWEKLRNASVPTPRWCDRAPYTLQCFYAAWSLISRRQRSGGTPHVTGRPLTLRRWPHAAPVPSTPTRLHHLGGFWHSEANAPSSEAMSRSSSARARGSPRSARDARGGLVTPRLHVEGVRDSVEKPKEARDIRRAQLPSTPASELVAQMLTRAQPGATFLQTSSDRAAEAFEAFARRSGTPLATRTTRAPLRQLGRLEQRFVDDARADDGGRGERLRGGEGRPRVEPDRLAADLVHGRDSARILGRPAGRLRRGEPRLRGAGLERVPHTP